MRTMARRVIRWNKHNRSAAAGILVRACGIVMLVLAIHGQSCGQAVASGETDSAIKVDVDLVNVLCNVYDKRGALVNDLTQEDFEVREDGKPQQLRYFARETNLPLTVALLVDVSGSVRRFVEAEKTTAARFLKDVLRSDDHALLMGFSSTMILWQDFTSSVPALTAALERLRAVPFRGLPADGLPMPGTLLYDAIYGTADQKMRGVPGRKVLVVISDGLDNGSQKKLEEAVAAAESTNTIVYGICHEAGFSGCSFLNNLAEPTGGRGFKVDPKMPLSKIFQTIEDEMRSQYALGYVPTNRAHDGAFRKLQVRVHKPGLRVRTRKGYFALQDKGD
jgi:VWFA-related protein